MERRPTGLTWRCMRRVSLSVASGPCCFGDLRWHRSQLGRCRVGILRKEVTVHSGFGWKVSDSRPGNNFWDKWSRTFLPIHRNQPRPYLVIFWTHVLVSSGGVWRGMRKWSIFGRFCLNLQHNLSWPPGSKCCVRRVSPGPKFSEKFEFGVRFQM